MSKYDLPKQKQNKVDGIGLSGPKWTDMLHYPGSKGVITIIITIINKKSVTFTIFL